MRETVRDMLADLSWLEEGRDAQKASYPLLQILIVRLDLLKAHLPGCVGCDSSFFPRLIQVFVVLPCTFPVVLQNLLL